MRRVFLMMVLLGGTGCATQVAKDPIAAVKPGGEKPIAFQHSILSGHDAAVLVGAEHLRVGDILLSAAKGLTSAGIRLFTLAPVSHAALYIGGDQVAEAVGDGVRVRSLQAVIDEESMVAAFRNPRVDEASGERIRDFAQARVGGQYNYVGVLMQAPFTIERRLCELPMVSETLRDACIQGIASVQLGRRAVRDDRFFCSQLVLEAYRQAGVPLTRAEPAWISPADILHMREGDVSSVQIEQPLSYVGHLKLPDAPLPQGEASRPAAGG
ncbi:YaeF family permuted papain-like enzyme [Niveibacterium sp. 24ML]|uniref:YaeF family permuted papain-like enzyme n=1 Tax=Niveibacterium sp. 24ML TaxID=2985512 RepID=UPI00226F465B|nr:YaeF family permuted papain-like enzyme [Niveibacterium sp. 24ML]MCX9155728.1 YaeF family permuted papain-like enzyme [Niveibacterium sp. 24ML]